METVKPELKWVSERIKCEIKGAFEELRKAVEEDVSEFKGHDSVFSSNVEFQSEPKWTFSVTRRSHINRVTVFQFANDHLEINIVIPSHSKALKVFPLLTPEGHRKFQVEGDESEPLFGWQLRRRVLEPILFNALPE